MTEIKTAPYGSWNSPITSDLIVKESIGLSQVKLDQNDIYWIEMRPSEGGRQVIVRYPIDGQRVDVMPRAFNARTRVHEYGGGDYAAHGGVVYFSNFADQQLYRQADGLTPQAIAQETGQDASGAQAGTALLRYADAVVDTKRNRVICVREDHRERDREATNTLVAIPCDGGEATILVSGNNFYSSPRLSPDASRLAWLQWNHPNMPWDGCELWTGEFATDGSIADKQLVAGAIDESIFQPEWSPDETLYFVSDRTGWWNIYRTKADEAIECVCEMEAEFGAPQWVFGLSTYAFESADRIVCTFAEQGIWRLGLIDTRRRKLERIENPYTEISFVRAAPGRAVFRAGSPTEPFSIIEMDLATRKTKVLQRAGNLNLDAGYISEPRPIEFPTENGLTARGEVDGDRLMIDGGSAGGYTTLCALVFRDAFKAGASYYGVSDLEALEKDTHKFESRYSDSLIGPYPERRDLYLERSPINFAENLSCPVIFFQGLEDKVVPPNQAEMMVEALRKKGVPVAYVAFEGEQHGFRRAENIKRALDGELYFYSRVFGFELADEVEPVAIENL